MPADQGRLTSAEIELEAALGGLAPAAHEIDRDALMFRLGRESVAGAQRRWQTAVAALLLVALTSWTWSMYRWRSSSEMPVDQATTPLPVAPVEYADPGVPRHEPSPRATKVALAHASTEAYLDLRNLVLARGVDALPAGTVASRQDVEPIIDWPADQRPPLMWLRARKAMQEGGGL